MVGGWLVRFFVIKKNTHTTSESPNPGGIPGCAWHGRCRWKDQGEGSLTGVVLPPNDSTPLPQLIEVPAAPLRTTLACTSSWARRQQPLSRESTSQLLTAPASMLVWKGLFIETRVQRHCSLLSHFSHHRNVNSACVDSICLTLLKISFCHTNYSLFWY